MSNQTEPQGFDREREYLQLLDEKTDIIRTLQNFVRELQEKIAQLTSEARIAGENAQRARLMTDKLPRRHPRQPGNCKGLLTIVANDDEHLKDFADYME